MGNGRGAYLIGQLNGIVVTDEGRRIDDQLPVEPVRFEAEFIGAVGFGTKSLRRRAGRQWRRQASGPAAGLEAFGKGCVSHHVVGEMILRPQRWRELGKVLEILADRIDLIRVVRIREAESLLAGKICRRADQAGRRIEGIAS